MEKDRPVNLINSFNLIFNQQLDEWTHERANERDKWAKKMNERDEWNEWFERTKDTVERWSRKNRMNDEDERTKETNHRTYQPTNDNAKFCTHFCWRVDKRTTFEIVQTLNFHVSNSIWCFLSRSYFHSVTCSFFRSFIHSIAHSVVASNKTIKAYPIYVLYMYAYFTTPLKTRCMRKRREEKKIKMNI